MDGLFLSGLGMMAVAGAYSEPAKVELPVSLNRQESKPNPSFFNPQLAIVGDFVAQLKDDSLSDGERRRADFREIEFGFKADADPFLTVEAYIAIANEDGETEVEVEEAFGRYNNLGRGWQAKFGKIAAAFGRVQRNHSDQLNYLDYPSPIRDLLGEEGLRRVGGSVSYLFPGDRFFEVTGEVLDAGDEGPFFNNSGADEPVYVAHARTFFDFTPDLSAQLGASYITGPGMDTDDKGNAFGVDFTAKWQPGTKGRSAIFEAEAFWAKHPQGGDRKLGWFARLSYEIMPKGFLTLGYDFSEIPFVEETKTKGFGLDEDLERKGWIAGFTYKVSEFHHWRLEWERQRSNFEDTRNRLNLQFQWVIGAHPAHRY